MGKKASVSVPQKPKELLQW